jgi:hypothetical protein
MIFIDSNVPMCLIGDDPTSKRRARHLLELTILRGERLVSDVAVLTEILHGYAAIDMRDAIDPALEALLGVVDEVYPIDGVDIDRARRILSSLRTASARQAIHAAIMIRHDVPRILSFDRGFDRITGIERISKVA